MPAASMAVIFDSASPLPPATIAPAWPIRRPGGAVCIIPVGSQHRGRLFLPFADDDPKTAEIVAKVLLLARDHEIKDPSILEQLRS